ncbi:MAG: flagellar export protein FliJ [Chloroflexota bacterium]
MAGKFALGPLLAYRSLQLDMARVQLAAAQRQLDRQMRYTARLVAGEDDLREQVAGALQASPADLDALRGGQGRLTVLHEMLRAARTTAEHFQQTVEDKRAAAVTAQQGKKVLERLMERHLAREAAEAQRTENKENDEIAITRTGLEGLWS